MRRVLAPAMESGERPPDGPPQRAAARRGPRRLRDSGRNASDCPRKPARTGAPLCNFGRNERAGPALRVPRLEVRRLPGPASTCRPSLPKPVARGIRAFAYSCGERQGIVWAYMGPQGGSAAPARPAVGPRAARPARGALKYQRACNWLQALEGDVDTAHLGWLHTRFNAEGGREAAFHERDRLRDVAVRDMRPALHVADTAAGVVIGARRDHESGDDWRSRTPHADLHRAVPAIGGQGRAQGLGAARRHAHAGVGAEPEFRASLRRGDARAGRGVFRQRHAAGRCGARRSGAAARLENDYLIDRSRQRESNFSGIEESPPLQDAAVQESMGAIVDRSRGRHPGRRTGIIVSASASSRRRAARPGRRAARRRGTGGLPPARMPDGAASRTRTGSPLRRAEQCR